MRQATLAADRLVRTELFGLRPPAVETFAVALTLAILRREALGEVAVREVWLTQPRRSAAIAMAFERGFGAPVRFGREIAGYLLEPEALGLAMRRADPLVGDLLELHAEHCLAAPGVAPLSSRVRALLLARPNDRIRAFRVARALGISERTLRRGLQVEGTSLRRELDAVLRERAIAALRHQPIDAVAAGLGYADESAFRRAFRRWCGVSPADYVRSAGSLTDTYRAPTG